MLRSPVFTGASSMISIESEEFETNMTAGVLLGMKQLEIHGKWWYHFSACFWVYLGVRTCDVFSLVFYLILDFGFCLIVSWLLVFFDKPAFASSKNKGF